MVQEEYPTIVRPSLETTAEIAAAAYDALGESDFAELPDFPEDDDLRITARWAMSTGDQFTGLDLLMGATDRLVYDAARDTITSNANREEGTRWGRETTGGKPCDFCEMLATRGAVYSSADEAGEADSYHDNCNCEVYPERP